MNLEQVRLIEELAANAWRPAVEQHLGGWRLRYSGGSSRRVNSVWPNASPGISLIEVGLDMVEAFYQRRSAKPCFQLCPAALPVELPDILAGRGYLFKAHTQVQVQAIETLLSVTSPPTGKVHTSGDLTDDWFRLYTTASGYSSDSLPVRRGILSRIGPMAQFVSLFSGDKAVATGLGVVERGWLGVFCVVSSPQFRQRGFAKGVMYVLAQWGKDHGADHIYLQVMDNNPPALNLYRKLGFTSLYQYYYAEKDGQDEIDH